MFNNQYVFLGKLFIILFLPTSIFPFIIILSTLTATHSNRIGDSIFEVMSSTCRCEVARIGSGLALLWVVIQLSHFILNKTRLYLENISQLIFVKRVSICFAVYMIIIILAFLKRKFYVTQKGRNVFPSQLNRI